MVDTLVDRIAQAIGDPNSIVKRRLDAAGAPAESMTRWGTRAVLAVLAEDLRLPTDPDDRDALAGPWCAVLSEHDGFVYSNYASALEDHGEGSAEEFAVTIARDSALPLPVPNGDDDELRMPGTYKTGDVAHELDDLYLTDPGDPSTAAGDRLVQARAMAAGLNLAAAIAESLAPAPTVAVYEVPPIGDILTLEPADQDAGTSPTVHQPGRTYLLRTIGEHPQTVKEINTVDETDDDLLEQAKDAADIAGYVVTDYRLETDRWVLVGGRHLNTGS